MAAGAERFWVPGALILGLLVGLLVGAFPLDHHQSLGHRISALLGWTYFCCWSVSFYPQLVQNIQTRSVKGLSLEFQLLNLVGFGFYFVFNAALFWDPTVRAEYSREHTGHDSTVQFNDVMFSLNAAVSTLLTLLTICAFYDYPRLMGPDRLLRYSVVTTCAMLVIAAGGMAAAIWLSSEAFLDWLSYITWLSLVKVAISVVKYCPQVWLNYRRQSTEGWSISNVLLDFLGGALSIAQLFLDAGMSGDWSGVTANPAKFLLGNLSMIFDVIFIVQHYCLYGEPTSDSTAGDSTPYKACEDMPDAII